MADLIDRQAAIDACIRVRELRAYDEIEEIKALPSAQPGRQKGKWINDGRIIRCSKCKIGYAVVKGMKSALMYNFCPNCGASMREEQDVNVNA